MPEPFGLPQDDLQRERWELVQRELAAAGFQVGSGQGPVACVRATLGEPPSVELRYFLADELMSESLGEALPHEYFSCALLALEEPLRFGVNLDTLGPAGFLRAAAAERDALAVGDLESFCMALQIQGLTYFMEP